ncbi:hypothetical protein FA10DRAFT_252457 [Acaromyces ingoldii]|uniref:Alpha/beta-hydrolase n=1 Tax=Acaromyces ingoldii TaxID=215250 RepID=A0A316YMP7_9BASI|nr:hypothetical protein FA10DRAFT_252457 [Acaromyces ingoldii]PWN90820.1 hypothetical protein FA10DRAFT_252457 [Acaromyces ingoldii]
MAAQRLLLLFPILVFFSALLVASLPSPNKRDAFVDLRGTDGDTHLTSIGTRPGGAFATNYRLSKGNLFVWQSKTPHNEADAEAVFIILHGVDRNANTYFTTLNSAYLDARDKGYRYAPENTLRISPLFFSTEHDAPALNASTLAWNDNNGWAGGDGSTHPSGSGMSSFTVFDELVTKFSDASKYPKVKSITLAAHGGGAQVIQRYAVLGRSARSGVSLRYVVGDPSTMLYFTRDRPVAVDTSSCPRFNDFRYGFSNYYEPYGLADSQAGLFKRYAGRDMRYIIGLDDESTTNGDQTCAGRGAGGAVRRDRSLAYWKYIHLLAGYAASSYDSFPGTFPALDSRQKADSSIPTTSNKATLSAYKNTKIGHKLYQVSGAGHSATEVFESTEGLAALFT